MKLSVFQGMLIISAGGTLIIVGAIEVMSHNAIAGYPLLITGVCGVIMLTVIMIKERKRLFKRS